MRICSAFFFQFWTWSRILLHQVYLWNSQKRLRLQLLEYKMLAVFMCKNELVQHATILFGVQQMSLFFFHIHTLYVSPISQPLNFFFSIQLSVVGRSPRGRTVLLIQVHLPPIFSVFLCEITCTYTLVSLIIVIVI